MQFETTATRRRPGPTSHQTVDFSAHTRFRVWSSQMHEWIFQLRLCTTYDTMFSWFL